MARQRTLVLVLVLMLALAQPWLATPADAQASTSSTTTLYVEDFDDGIADGFTMTGLWRVSSVCGDAPSRPYMLGYQRAGSCDIYGSNTQGTATFTLDLPAADVLQMTFQERIMVTSTMCVPENNCESWGSIATWVEARRPGASTWTQLGRSGTGCGYWYEWHGCTVNLTAWAGGPAEVRFRARGVSEEPYDGSGFYVDSLVVTATNLAVIARAGADATWRDADGTGAEVVRLDGSASAARAGIASYEWRKGTATLATTATANVSLPVGAHTILLIVTDVNGAQANDTVVHTVLANRAPVAQAGADVTVRAPIGGTATVTVNGGASYDPDGPLAAYEWTHGGVVFATTPSATRTLPPGDHTLTLRVTDAGGLSASDSLLARVVENRPPVAAAGPDAMAKVGADGTATFTLDGRASADPDGGPLVAYSWSRDGAVFATTAVAQLTLPLGQHDVTLTVEDDLGATASDSVRLSVVTNAPPYAAAEARCEERHCRLDASASGDPDGRVVAYRWDLGGGRYATGRAVDHRFAGYGTHEVALEVEDDDGATARTTFSVVTQPVPEPARPTMAPLHMQVTDNLLFDYVDNTGLSLNADRAWFAASSTSLYVAIDVASLEPVAPALGSTRYVVEMVPSWTPADPTWGGVLRPGERLRHLELRATLPPQGASAITYELGLVRTTSSAFLFLGQAEGEADMRNTLLWVRVPRALLQEPAEGPLRIDLPRLRVDLVAPTGTSHTMDRGYAGSSFLLPGRSFERALDYPFTDADGGFRTVRDASFSRVAYDDVVDAIVVHADRRAEADEIFAQGLPVTMTPDGPSFSVSARWTVTQQGNHQSVVPLFVGKGSLRDVTGTGSSLHVDYDSRDSNLRQTPRYWLRYIDAGGTTRAAAEVLVPASSPNLLLELSYDAPSRTLRASLASAQGSTLAQIQYVVGTNGADGFVFDLFGVAADGWSGTSEPAAQGRVDDVRVAWTL